MSTVKIRDVDSITLKLLKSQPPALLIHATGHTLTGQYTSIALNPRIYVRPPADGIWEFDFTGDPPTGIHDQLVTPVTADYEWKDVPATVKGIKIYSASNYKVVMLSQSNESKTLRKDIEVIKAEAWVNTQPVQPTPGGTLVVSLDYNSNNAGFHRLIPAHPQGINPKILLLELTDEPEMIFIFNPRHASYSQGLASVDQYTSVEIRYHGSNIATIEPIPVIS
ncbi:MAG: hypothetical protein JST32_08565 [Bacteroidetes bacterium]|nr:hypothetical protein [Bacteroidota bacterium]